jgi:hypothetical protein|tara:strand:+ start:875 stop:1123 length:249 start_codon:yes stop_codon:yes gene_type:complete
MNTETISTEEPRPNYPYLTGALKSALKYLSNDLAAAGLITKDQIKAVNKIANQAYERCERNATTFEKARVERKEAFYKAANL